MTNFNTLQDSKMERWTGLTIVSLEISKAIIIRIMTRYKVLRADVESKPSLLFLCFIPDFDSER